MIPCNGLEGDWRCSIWQPQSGLRSALPASSSTHNKELRLLIRSICHQSALWSRRAVLLGCMLFYVLGWLITNKHGQEAQSQTSAGIRRMHRKTHSNWLKENKLSKMFWLLLISQSVSKITPWKPLCGVLPLLLVHFTVVFESPHTLEPNPNKLYHIHTPVHTQSARSAFQTF